VQFIGTATTLIRYGGFTLLTDPNFLHAGDHAHLGYGMTSPRLTDPAMEIEDLPAIDLCVLSHFHGDHWDEVATARLPKSMPILTTRHAARALRRRGFSRAHPLATWEAASVEKDGVRLRVTAMPGRHGPPLVAALLPPVMGSMLEWSARDASPHLRIYVSGDTLVHEELRRIPRRYSHVDIGLFHLGGTRIAGVLVTMDAEQGIQAIRIVRPDVAIPIHFDDYPVFKSPLADFSRAAAEAGLAHHVEYLQRGETYRFHMEGPGRADEIAAQVTPRWAEGWKSRPGGGLTPSSDHP
jgi:L-ascorbate metabolism protein UlaG (beta-lactamase superfamily)